MSSNHYHIQDRQVRHKNAQGAYEIVAILALFAFITAMSKILDSLFIGASANDASQPPAMSYMFFVATIIHMTFANIILSPFTSLTTLEARTNHILIL